MQLEYTIIKGDYIQLIQLLKVMSLASSGSEAKILVDDGKVYVNNIQELRRRAKVRVGDEVELKSDEKNIIIMVK
jgi:ribosome-associated protein